MKFIIKKMASRWCVFQAQRDEKVGHVKIKNGKVFFRTTDKAWLTGKDLNCIHKLCWQLLKNHEEGRQTARIDMFDHDLRAFMKQEFSIAATPHTSKPGRYDRIITSAPVNRQARTVRGW